MEKIISENNKLPKGTTNFIIHQIKKSAETSLFALTELIDDAIDAVRGSKNEVINITNDKHNGVLVVEDNGCGMSLEILQNILNQFESHHYADALISKFGLGRWYPIFKIPLRPNITIETSTGNGVLYKGTLDVIGEDWNKLITESPCPKSRKGTTVTINFVNENEFPEDIELMSFLGKHYAFSNTTIKYNGVEIQKNDPLFTYLLQDGLNTTDGVYVNKGIVHQVSTHVFTNNEDRMVVVRFIGVSIAAAAFANGTAKERDDESPQGDRAAEKGGIYTILGTNILNKGHNGEFINKVLTRGGSGSARLGIYIISDNNNVLDLDDVKAKGCHSFMMNKRILNEYKDSESHTKLFEAICRKFNACSRLYNLIGQSNKGHVSMGDEEILTVVNKTDKPKYKPNSSSKVCNRLKGDTSSKVHINTIEKYFDYMTSNETGILSVSIPNNSEGLCIEVNPTKLPDNWNTLRKEEILIAMGKFLMEEIGDANIFNKFNQAFASYKQN